MTGFVRPLALALVFSLSPLPATAEPLAVTTHPIRNFAIASTERRFGLLEFLGGLEIVSPDSRFGGISGIEVTNGGRRAMLVSDDGYLIRGDLTHDGADLSGFDNVEIDRIFPGSDMAKDDNDVEDIALDPADPTRGAIVLERRRQALTGFRIAGGVPASFQPIAVKAPDALLESNTGLESVAFAPPGSPAAGRIVAIAEDARKPRRDRIPGWIIGSGAFTIVKRDDFDISSARFLPGGDLMLLERRYTPGWGVAMRLRRISAAKLVPGGELDGEILLEGGLLNQIDNMEGLSVHRDEFGRTILTLVSDDNKSVLQRTVMLQFAIAGED